MEREQILQMLREILLRQGRSADVEDSSVLSTIGFRSLDFSELALRVEHRIGRELNFDAGQLRQIRTVGDVIDFLVRAAG